MKTTHSRKLARRIIGIAATIAFVFFWGALMLVMRPKIEERLLSETQLAISGNADASNVQVAFRGRDARLTAEFETEEERGRFQSFVKNLSVPGVRQIENEFTVRHVEMTDPEFRLTIREQEASISGVIGDADIHSQLMTTVRMAANGLPLKDDFKLAENVHPAPWAEALTQFLPHLSAGAANPRVRVSDGSIRIAGHILDPAHKAAIDGAIQTLVAAGLTLTDDMTVGEAPIIEPDVPAMDIRTYGKKVVVRGLLPLGGAREVILGAVQQGAEPGTVEDSLVVKENVAEPLWMPTIAKLSPILLNSTTDPVLAITSDQILVSGEARDDEARSEMESLVQQAATASGLPSESKLTIPAPLDPVVLSLSNTGSTLRLSGTLPDESFHQKLLTAIRRGSANLPLTDEAIIGENVAVPKWNAALEKFVTEFLIHSDRGEIRVEDDRLSVDVFAANADRAEAIELAVKYLDGSDLELLPMKMEVAKTPEPDPTPAVAEPVRTSNVTESGASLRPPSFLNEYIIYFGHGTALLKKKDVDLLRGIAEKLKQHADQNFVIAAFSDSSGNGDFNTWLRGERAEAVRDRLVRFGVRSDSLTIKGFGSLGPKNASKDDPRLREFRRVEILTQASNRPVTERDPDAGEVSPTPSTNADAQSLARFFKENADGAPVMLASLTNSRVLAWAVARSSGNHLYSVALDPQTSDAAMIVPRAVPVMRPDAIGTIYFEHGTAMLKSRGREAVRALAAKLRDQEGNAPFFISGYADPVGDPEFNNWLSKERADAVRKALLREGISGERIRIRAHGHADLVAETDTEEGLRLNRRVEIHLGY